MKFNDKTGTLELSPLIKFYRGMKRSALFDMEINWDTRKEHLGEAINYKAVISLIEFKNVGDLYIFAYFSINDGVLRFLDLSPDRLMDGSQSKPEGKYTKIMRKWFLEACGVQLPVGGEWGHIDASHDPWNSQTSIVCNYRDRFDTEDEWNQYRRWNKF